MPDYIAYYRGTTYIAHSAKGSSWKKHKYIKKIGDVYYYTKEQLAKAGKAIADTEIYSETKSVNGGSGYKIIKDKHVTIGSAAKNLKKSIAGIELYGTKTTVNGGAGPKVIRNDMTTVGDVANRAKKAVSSATKKVANVGTKTATNLYSKGKTAIQKIMRKRKK